MEKRQMKNSDDVRNEVVAVFASTFDALLQELLKAYESGDAASIAKASCMMAQASHVSEKFFLKVAQDNCTSKEVAALCNSSNKALVKKIEALLDEACDDHTQNSISHRTEN
jgi:hypothetical protein